jgi:transcriptional regulator with XRE-family HTH domain
MAAIGENLRRDLRGEEFSEGYAESFQDAYVATQIKVLREQNGWTQEKLAEELGTTQTVISRIESVNYSKWNTRTLKKIARAYRLRLKISFETFGSLIHDVENFSKENLRRCPREHDPELAEQKSQAIATAATTGLLGLAGFDQATLKKIIDAQAEPVRQIQLAGGTLQSLAGVAPPEVKQSTIDTPQRKPPQQGTVSGSNYFSESIL